MLYVTQFNFLETNKFNIYLFHVKRLALSYLPNSTSMTLMSLGETPGMRLA